MKKILVLICVFLCAFPLWGEYFYNDDAEIFTLSHICRRMGKTLPFTSFPVHGSDILDYAHTLTQDTAVTLLNDVENGMLDSLILKLENMRNLNLSAGGRVGAAYEHRLSSGSFLFGDKELPESEDVRRAYLGFPPFFNVYGETGFFEGLHLALNVDLRPSWENNLSPSSNFPEKVDVMFDMITKGIFSYNGKYLNLMIGRDSAHWGNAAGSTLYASSLIPHLDGIRMNVPLGRFTFDYSLSTIMPKRARYRDVDDAARRDYPELENSFNVNQKNRLGDHFGFMKDVSDDNPSIIFFMQNRFQWNYGKVKAGIGSTVVYARGNNQFLFTDFLPVFNHHNADSAPNNFSLILDAQWTIFPGFSISAMVGFDDISAKSFGLPDGEVPTIPGAIIQLEYGRADGNLFQRYMLETGYTHYLWGNFAYTDEPESWYGVYLARAIYRFTPNAYAVLLPLTSPYGPGSLWAKFNGKFTFTQINLEAGFEVLLLFKNSGANLVMTPYEEDGSLAGFDRWFLTVDVPLTYKWRDFKFLVSPALLISRYKTVFGCTLGFRWQTEGKVKL